MAQDIDIARFRSAKVPDLVHYVFENPEKGLRCSCSGFAFRGRCGHVEDVLRRRAWGCPLDPTEILPPPAKWEVSRG